MNQPGSPEDPPSPSWSQQLRELQPREGEAQTAFLGRAARLVGSNPEAEIDLNDLKNLRPILPVWTFDEVGISDETWVAARRQIPIDNQHVDTVRDRIAEQPAARLTDDSYVLILAKSAFSGRHLQNVFEIEQLSIAQPGSIHVNPPGVEPNLD